MLSTVTTGFVLFTGSVLGAVSLYIVAAYLAWAWLGRPGRESHSPRPWVAAAVEWLAVLRVLRASLHSRWWPLLRLARGRDGGVPVLCVHGYVMDAGNFRWMARELETAGCGPVYAVNLEGLFRPIPEYASQFVRALDQVVLATGAPAVDVVCHSMGGLVVRAALERPEGGRIRRVVTLGTPAQGTVLARVGWGANARQMRPGSPFMRGLAAVPESFTAIWSSADAMVLPCSLARASARDVVLHDVGHLSLLFSRRATQAVILALTATSPSAPVREPAPLPVSQDVLP